MFQNDITMKKLLTLFAIALAIVVSSCSKFDDSAIWDKLNEQEQTLNDHEKRIAALEELCKQMNTNINALQTLVEALEKRDYITNVSPVREDGVVVGYTISFASSDTITIYNGKDGNNGTGGYTPQIGVKKDADGLYYWTLDGEWLLDDNGNKIKAVGEDGQDGTDGSNGSNGQDGEDGTDGRDGVDGVTPRLKIENDYWYVSYDEGATWIELGKATGEDGTDGSNGEDGDNIFASVTQDDEYVYFNLADGTIITLPKTNINSNIIQFEDRYVKAICVSNWDTDGDGELSYEEAAAVEDIGLLFSFYHVSNGEVIHLGNSSILSFDELKYFTGITKLSNKAFNYDINLSSIIIPENVNEIADGNKEMIDGRFDSTEYLPYGTFAYTKINSIIIPDNVTKIGNYAFYDCAKLNNISIGSGVKSIGSQAFYNCGGELYINSGLVEDNYTKQPTWLHDTNFLKITIGEDIEAIGNNAFIDLDSLQDLIIGNNVLTIGDYAFSECGNLVNIHMPDTIISLGNYSFSECISLTNLDLPNSIYSIGDYAFSECDGLIYLEVPSSVMSIGKYCFKSCSAMTSITLGENITTIGNYAFDGCPLSSLYCKTVVPPTVSTSGLGTLSQCFIYVPKESVAEYRVASGWSKYADRIVGYDFQ